MRTLLLLVTVFALCAAAQDPGQPGFRTASASFTATSLDGMTRQFNTAGQITAVIYVSAQCPVSNAYNQRMEALYKDYGSRVRFLFLNANSTESASEIAKHAQEQGFTFPVYRDVGNTIADRLNAQFTPETYLLGPDGVIRYHGRIDDQRDEAQAKTHNFRDALDALLAGQPVAVPEAKAFGCSIKRVKKAT